MALFSGEGVEVVMWYGKWVRCSLVIRSLSAVLSRSLSDMCVVRCWRISASAGPVSVRMCMDGFTSSVRSTISMYFVGWCIPRWILVVMMRRCVCFIGGVGGGVSGVFSVLDLFLWELRPYQYL